MTDIHFVTNRRPNRQKNPDDFSGEFSSDGIANLRYGTASLQADGSLSLELVPEKLKRDPSLGRLDPKASRLGSQAAMKHVRNRMRDENSDLLVFVHGYNVSFREAVESAAALQDRLRTAGRKVIVLLFSWPSDGSMMPFLAYASDRQDAAASGPAFGRAFLKLSDFLNEATPEQECDQSVHLVAHSMGNYVLRHALQTIRRERAGRLPRVFDQVLLMAADEDDDAFEHAHKMQLLPNICRRASVYFNRGDLALHVSDKTKGNPDRLGTDGARVPGQLPARISEIDCSGIIRGAIEHSYYVESAEVAADVVSVLAGTPSDQVPGRSYVPETNQFRL